MRWKTGTLIGLKHAVAESVLLREMKIGLHVRLHHILKLRITSRRAVHGARRTGNRDQVRTIHFAVVIHFQEPCVRVAGVVVVRRTASVPKIEGCELDCLSQGVDAAGGDICAARNEKGVLKEVVGCSIFLKDNDDVLDFRRRRWGRDGCDRARAPSTAGIEP